MAKSQDRLQKTVKNLPNAPGVYKFLGKKGQILYIGKATSLKSRVRSYFAKDLSEKRSPLIEKMVQEAVSLEYEKTNSVLEALILEARLIKQHTPPYNTADKDQKSFNYVVITKEKFPRVLVVRERDIFTDSRFQILDSKFGPFPHNKELKEALKIVRKIFPFRDKCVPFVPPSPALRRGAGGEVRGCFNYQIGLCPGVCAGVITEKEYARTIRHIKTFFNGNMKKLQKDLEQEMKSLAKQKEFEKATEIKSKIFALQHINDIALIKKDPLSTETFGSKSQTFRIEAYDIAHISGANMVGVMTVLEDGEAKKSDYRMFKIKGRESNPTSLQLREMGDTGALREVLERRFKHNEWPFPSLIVMDGGVAQLNVGEEVIKNLNLNIPVVAVTKDERRKAKKIIGASREALTYEKHILLSNSEAHRFAISFHRRLRDSIKNI